MLEFLWEVVYRLYKRSASVCDPSFETVCLFALLGLVLTALLLDLDGWRMPGLPYLL